MANKNLIHCNPELFDKDLTGNTYLVTGANSGVGLVTTKQLIKQGAKVIMACRRHEAAEKEAIAFESLKGGFDIHSCDLTQFESVRSLVAYVYSSYEKIDGLICNAGMVNMKNKAVYTNDGFEITMATSIYGHFLLTELLLDLLKKSEDGRMIILSSVVHAGSPKNRYRLHFDDLDWKKRKYNNSAAYGEAKVASVLYAKELSIRLKNTNVTTYSVHPGWARSNFGGGGNLIINALLVITKPTFKILNISDSSWESSQTTLHCLLSDDAKNHSGAYFSQHSVLYQDKDCKKGGWPMKSPNPYANNLEDAQRLVDICKIIVSLGK